VILLFAMTGLGHFRILKTYKNNIRPQKNSTLSKFKNFDKVNTTTTNICQKENIKIQKTFSYILK